MKKIFIDCGAWEGNSIVAFKKHYNNADDYIIYAFECEPRLQKKIKQVAYEQGFIFINKAVSTSNDPILLYQGIGDYTQSGSLLSSKKKFIDKENPILVDAIDFSQWIINNFNKDDYIVCKMNIEGAEYAVLEKMINDGSIQYINKCYIAFHHKKIKGISEDRHDKLKKYLGSVTELKGFNFDRKCNNPF